MCNKLTQSFACGHTKTICSTPCVHALRQHNKSLQHNTTHNTAQNSLRQDATHTTHQHTTHRQEFPTTASSSASEHTLARSDSTKSYASISSTGLLLRRGVSKLKLGSGWKGKARTGSDASMSMGGGYPAAFVPGTGTGTGRGMGSAMGRTQTTPVTPTRAQQTTPKTPMTPWPSISPSTPNGKPSFAVPLSSVSCSSVDAPVPVSSLSPVSPFTPTAIFTTTTTTTATSTSRSESGPSTPPKPIEPAQTSAPYVPTGHPALGDGAEEPRFCDYYFPRCLTASQYPCRECYGKEEWEGLRKKWVESYRLGHPLDVLGEAEVERLSGVVLFVEAEGKGKVELELDGVGRAV